MRLNIKSNICPHTRSSYAKTKSAWYLGRFIVCGDADQHKRPAIRAGLYPGWDLTGCFEPRPQLGRLGPRACCDYPSYCVSPFNLISISNINII